LTLYAPDRSFASGGYPLFVDTNVHGRFRIAARFLVLSIFPMSVMLVMTVIISAATVTWKNTAGGAEQGCNAY